MSAAHSDAAVVEVRLAARAALIATVRTVASDLAGRADFDLDAISDLRMAVDEACATLIGLAAENATLTCTFVLDTDHIGVTVSTQTDRGETGVNTDSFGWRVLQTLADEVSTTVGTDGDPETIGIHLLKRSGEVP